jgi:uncharacterized protein (TIGR03067 family)
MSDGSVYRSWTVLLSQEDGLIFGYLDLSKEALGGNNAQRIFQSFRRGTRQGQTHTLLSDVEISLGAIPGRDYTIALQNGADGYIRERNYLAGLRLYRLIIVGSTKDATTSETVQHFLDSFQIGDVTATPVMEKLEGFFHVISCERDGEKVDVTSGKTCFFSPVRTMIFVKIGDATPRVGNILVDNAASPKQLDLISPQGADDWVHRAIFELNAGEVKLCIADSGLDRPTEFNTTPGSGRTLYLLRRR